MSSSPAVVTRPRRRAGWLAAAVVGAVLAGVLSPAVPARAAAPVAVADVVVDPCAAGSAAAVRCGALERRAVVTDPATGTQRRASAAEVAAEPTAAAATPITPAQVQKIYGVSGLTPPAGTTVGIVVAYDAPDVEADLATFRARYGLPACTTANGCFRKVDQRGVTVPAGKATTSTRKPVYRDDGWQLETTLDTQAVSAMCPACSILLVEADDISLTASLGPAVLEAQTLGATVISNSFGGGESADEVDAERDYWSRATVPVFAGSGDVGHADSFGDAHFPAVSPSVVAVGGTSMTLSGSTVTRETAWSGAGSGCSVVFGRPAWQQSYFTASAVDPSAPNSACTTDSVSPRVAARAYADVSALADPTAPGFPVRLRGTWTVGGGTSLAVQLVAALAAYAGPRGSDATPTAQVAYRLSALAVPTGLADVTGGNNRVVGDTCGTAAVCTAGRGWDGPTGLGTPRGLSVFAPLLNLSPQTTVPGGTVVATGADFAPGETVTISTADGTAVATTTVTTAGTYKVSFTVPTTASSPVAFTVSSATTGFSATRSVTFGAPTLSLTPATGAATAVPLGAVTAGITNFAADERVTVAFTGLTPVEAVTDDTGAASVTLTLPATANGTATARAFGTESGFGATATVAVATAAVTPSDQQVRAGSTARLVATGFGAGEQVSVSDDAGTVLATATADAGGVATPTWVPASGTVGTTGVTVSGASTARSVRVLVDLLLATGDPPAAPSVLSVVPTTDGGALVAVRVAAAGPAASNVTVLGSDGVIAGRVPVGAGGDAFVTVASIAAGTTTTFEAIAGNESGDSLPGADSLPVTGTTADGTGDLTPVGPVRLVDSRLTGGPLGPGGSRSLPVAGRAGVPATGVAAVVVSVTVLATSAATYLTVWPSGETRPTVSNANLAAGATKTSLAKVKLGTGGAIALFNYSGQTHVIVDVVGYYAAAGSGFAHNQSYAGVRTPTRVVDTRALAASPVRQAGGTLVVPVRGGAGGVLTGVPVDATSVELSVQAVDSRAQGYLTVYPSGAGARPVVSNVQFDAGRPGVTSVVSTIGADGTVSVFASQGTEVIVDVLGYYAASAAGRFVPISPRRYLDTRPAYGGSGPLGAAQTRTVRLAGGTALDGSRQVPAAASAVSFSLTSTDNTASTYLTAWASGAARPLITSLLPYVAFGTYDNLALSAAGTGGAVAIYSNAGSVNVIVDVQGYYTQSS